MILSLLSAGLLSAQPAGPLGVADPVVTVPAADEASPASSPAPSAAGPDDASLAAALRAGNVLKGMTMTQVVAARGEPRHKDVIPPDAELWRYADGEVAFAAGRVTYVSLPARSMTPPPPPSMPSVPMPALQIGDTWVYESRDLNGKEPSQTTRRTVTATGAEVVLASVSLDHANAKTRWLHFTGEWNLVATRGADGSGLDYSPPLAYYEFPLHPGKTWQRTTTETNRSTGAVRIHSVRGRVEHWETVTVPAGTFNGLRVVLETSLLDQTTGERVVGTDTSWYVPQVRRSVQSITTGKGGSRRALQLLRYSLMPGG